MKLSIIVPVFNSELYLSRCLESLLIQGIDKGEYEIICVDDGSTDGSSDMLRMYEEKYPEMVKVVRQENAGAPMARNRGIEEASGEVITFCDADDYIVEGAYAFLLERFWTDEIDVLKFNSVTMDRYMLQEWKEPECFDDGVEFEGSGHDFYNRKMLYFVWSNMYRRSFIEEHHLEFRDMKLCDDSMFCLDVFMANPRTKAVNANVYRYTVVDDSLTKSRNADAMKRIVESYMRLLEAMDGYAKQFEGLSAQLYLYREQQMVPCMSRALSANYDKREFGEFRNKLSSRGVYPLSRMGMKSTLLNVPLASYCSYSACSLLYRKVFVPYLLGRIRKN